jgi:uncharacterized protein
MFEKETLYFEKCGKENTEQTIKAAKKRAEELNITNIVVGTTRGKTALAVSEIFNDQKYNIVAVTLSHGTALGYGEAFTMTDEERRKLTDRGVKVFTGLHALGHNVGSSFKRRYRGEAIESAVQDTLYCFCVGMKVCVECVLMAADAALIPVGEEVIAIGGTGWGADTSAVVKSACPEGFHDLEIREIIAKPRSAKAIYEGGPLPKSA